MPSTTRSAATPFVNQPVPTAQRRLIIQALQRYERLKPAYAERGLAILSARTALAARDSTIAKQQRVVMSFERTVGAQDVLLRNSAAQVQVWRTKARRRGVIIGLGVGLPAAYGLYRLLR